MPTVELERQAGTERQTRYMWPVKSERVDERRQSIGVAVQSDRLRGIRRAAAARRVPGHRVELVGEGVDLRHPLATVTKSSVQEEERQSAACPSVGDAEARDLDVLHSCQANRVWREPAR